jgi:single stranded DNA-binding protein
MADINNVTFTGRLTKDAIKKQLPTGTELVVFDFANNTGFGKFAKTAYFTVQLWGKQGTGVLPYLTKGQQIGIAGTLEVQEWTDDYGKTHRKNIVNSNFLSLLGSKQAEPASARFSNVPDPFGDQYSNVQF